MCIFGLAVPQASLADDDDSCGSIFDRSLPPLPGLSISPTGKHLYASWWASTSDAPLGEGHLAAWQLQSDPTADDFGELLDAASAGESWDAGPLLAAREALHGEVNAAAPSPTGARTGYTARWRTAFMHPLLPFDESSLSAHSNLHHLLVPHVNWAENPHCAEVRTDFDHDCDSDIDDARYLIDFYRGVAGSAFDDGTERGTWRLGSMGSSIAVEAPAQVAGVATQAHYAAWKEKLATLPATVFLSSNAGMLHAFDVGPDGLPGQERWFYVPRSKADHRSHREVARTQLQGVVQEGPAPINDGRLVLDNAWLDGYSNGLPATENTAACPPVGWSAGLADGQIHQDGCEWHRVLLAGGGAGSRLVIALDVTNPEQPHSLWERSAAEGAGRTTQLPAVGPFLDASTGPLEIRWLSAWTSGLQTSESVSAELGHGSSPDDLESQRAALYLHDLDPFPSRVPTAYPWEGVPFDHPDLAAGPDGFDIYGADDLGGIGGLSLADLDGDGGTDVGWFGDSTGRLFKVLFDPHRPDQPTVCSFGSAATTDGVRAIENRPAVSRTKDGELLVAWGSGTSLSFSKDVQGGLYVLSDPDPFGCSAGVPPSCAGQGALDEQGHLAFTGRGEHLSGEPIVVAGKVWFTTRLPDLEHCHQGRARLYSLDMDSCEGGWSEPASEDRVVVDSLYTEVEGVLSRPLFANDRVYVLAVDAGGADPADLINVPAGTTPPGLRFRLADFRKIN